MMSCDLKVFIITGDMSVLVGLEKVFNDLGCHLLGTSTHGEEALERLENTRPDIVVVYKNLSGGTRAYDIIDLIIERFGLPVLFIADRVGPEGIARLKLLVNVYTIIEPYGKKELYSAMCELNSGSMGD